MTMARGKAGPDFYTEVESAFKESMAENLADAVARDPRRRSARAFRGPVWGTGRNWRSGPTRQ